MWIDLNFPSLLQTVITAQMQHCLCCKLYCFLFLEFLEIQRWNAVQSFSQPDFQCRHEQLMICITVWSRIHATIHQACFVSLHNWDVVCQISGVAIKTGPGIQPPWMLFEPEPTRAPSRSLLAAHWLHLFLRSHIAQLRMILQTVLFCQLRHPPQVAH